MARRDQLGLGKNELRKQVAGAHRGRVQTSNFSNPLLFLLVQLSKSGTNAVLAWPAAAGLFTVQFTTTLAPGSWNAMSPQPAIVLVGDQYQALIPTSGGARFFRLAR